MGSVETIQAEKKKLRHVVDEAGVGAERLYHEPGDGRTDDLRRLHGLAHERVDRHQATRRRQRADGDGLRRDVEARDRAEQKEDAVDGVEIADEEERDHQHAADQIARDHGPFDVPFVHEYAGERADDGQRRHVSGENHADLCGRAVQLKGDYADDGEDGQEITENADDLGDPQTFDGRGLEDVAEA